MQARTLAASVLLLAAGCGSATSPAAVPGPAVDAAAGRLEQVQRSLDTWGDASTLPVARAAAARVNDLIVGRPGTVGLLPSEDGDAGLATAVASCAGPDLLGGSWDDPAERWAILATAIDEWTPSNNTFPTLPSHAQRVVGWATLTVRAVSLEQAHEYSGHARLHVAAARDALADCR